jgi:hypothetical protein
MITGPKRLPELEDSEWFQVYRLLQSRNRRLTQEDVYGTIQLVLWDRTPREMICHGGESWTL